MISKFICWLFGHTYRNYTKQSEDRFWKSSCERCSKPSLFTEKTYTSSSCDIFYKGIRLIPSTDKTGGVK